MDTLLLFSVHCFLVWMDGLVLSCMDLVFVWMDYSLVAASTSSQFVACLYGSTICMDQSDAGAPMNHPATRALVFFFFFVKCASLPKRHPTVEHRGYHCRLLTNSSKSSNESRFRTGTECGLWRSRLLSPWPLVYFISPIQLPPLDKAFVNSKIICSLSCTISALL